ncbi:carboxypeptidase-like regulatory domain-containing protein [Pontibacter sp. JH31]|uniref:Carboxypeptidase-like regulatory domain-containing protein n=1 Tax=Pontibacter aquaedesilientis TaxID=2766980 RepID=A0ABR7XEE0_9BACT|nr:carboxypeptidase-like regulatory domain-containing protein [Pontibacter aquaedesilientis]MBD1396668.1 carboxypeptidase-like regulatory domain-containing protein [Pontibacter aquaedesilientis]
MLRHPLLFFLLTCLLLVCALPTLAQRTVRISGTILQADKTTPVPGAGIIRYGTTFGVVSDEDGKFLIDVDQSDTLLIRAIGFKPLLYLPRKLPVSEFRVNIVLQQDSVMLGEVEVTSRPSEEMIQRALRNMKREEPDYVKRPGYQPDMEPGPPPPPVAPTPLNPISLLYDMFSKEGKQNQKLQQLLLIEELKRRKQEKDNYNRFFKDNTGYEIK